ncbi:hypothetical protein D3C78_1765460 [compost metagenome]
MGQLHMKLVLECGMCFNQRISSRYELSYCPIDVLRIRIGQNFELANKYLRHTFCIPAIAFLRSWVALALSIRESRIDLLHLLLILYEEYG